MRKAYFGGGCFWCLEATFNRLRGVSSVVSGYAGGEAVNPTYEQVSGGNTGHAEVIEVTFDEGVISYRDLLTVYFAMHDPTTLNRQGNDVGEQYRSIVLTVDDTQTQMAREIIDELTNEGVFAKPIVTEVKPLDVFYPAEKYHQRYYDTNTDKPYCSVVISPKLAKLRQKFAALMKDESTRE